MASFTKAEQKAMHKGRKLSKAEKKAAKQTKIPYFNYWNKEEYLKTFTPRGYPDGAGLYDKRGQGQGRKLKIPRFKLWLGKAKWYMPIVFVGIGVAIFFLAFILGYKGGWNEHLKEIFSTVTKGDFVWKGRENIIAAILGPLGIWFGFKDISMLVLYHPYQKKKKKELSVVDIQTKNIEKNRKKYGIFSFEELLPKLGPGKEFTVTPFFDTTTLHPNSGWVIKAGVTNDPAEISLLKKGYISKRMWEEKPDDLINPFRDAFSEAGSIPDKNYVYYVVAHNTIHAISEGETGSGKTECYASPESIFSLRNASHPSVLFTCKSGDEKATIDQAKCLDIKVQHIQLHDPGASDSFNPLYIPYLFHKLQRQLKFSSRPRVMHITPWDWENQYDIEIRLKSSKAISVISDISSKEQFMEELAAFTGSLEVESLMPNWRDESITLLNVVNVYRSWEDKKYIIVDIKKHFLITNRLQFWTESKKKSTNVWYKCGNWIFESVDEYNNNKELLISTIGSKYKSELENVITNVMNEENKVTSDSFWTDQARAYIKAFVQIYFDFIEMGDFSNNNITMSDAYFSLPTICAWINKYCGKAETMEKFVEDYQDYIPIIKAQASNFNLAEDTFSSIVGSINSVTQFYNETSELLPIITKNDFNPLDFALQQTLLCINTNNNEAAKANVLLKDIVGQVINCCDFVVENYRNSAGKNTMPRPVRVIVDEAGSGAPIPWASVVAIATKGRSKQIYESMYYQTIGQIQKQYKKVENATDELFGNMPLQRCIMSKAEESLKRWEGILGRGIATSKHDKDKKEELAGSQADAAYFPAEYIRTKKQWNSLIKIGTYKTIDVSSTPLYPTYFIKQLAVEAKKHETKDYKKAAVTEKSFKTNRYIDLEEILNHLQNAIAANSNFVVDFNQLINEKDVVGNQPKMTAFGKRFAPTSNLQNYSSVLDYSTEWVKKYEKEGPNLNQSFQYNAESQPNVIDSDTGEISQVVGGSISGVSDASLSDDVSANQIDNDYASMTEASSTIDSLEEEMNIDTLTAAAEKINMGIDQDGQTQSVIDQPQDSNPLVDENVSDNNEAGDNSSDAQTDSSQEEELEL